MNTVIGFDIGHSSIKIEAASGGKKRVSLLIPSHACPAVPVDVDDAAENARKETVTLDGQDWFFGHTALTHGRNLPTGLSDDWVKTPEHTALFLGGLKALRDAGVPDVDDALIILGLPGRTFSTQRHTLATPRETMADWLESTERALSFYGGVTQLIVPDNPKAMIADASKSLRAAQQRHRARLRAPLWHLDPAGAAAPSPGQGQG